MPTLDDVQKMAGSDPQVKVTRDEGYTPLGFEDLITLKNMGKRTLAIFFEVGRMPPEKFYDPDEKRPDDFAITDDQLMMWTESAQEHGLDGWKVSITIKQYRDMRQELEMIKVRRRYVLDLRLAAAGIAATHFREKERELFHRLHLRPSTFPISVEFAIPTTKNIMDKLPDSEKRIVGLIIERMQSIWATNLRHDLRRLSEYADGASKKCLLDSELDAITQNLATRIWNMHRIDVINAVKEVVNERESTEV